MSRVAKELKRIASEPVSDAELKGMHEYMQKGLANGPNVPYWYAKAQSYHWNNSRDYQWLKPEPAKIKRLVRRKIQKTAKTAARAAAAI